MPGQNQGNGGLEKLIKAALLRAANGVAGIGRLPPLSRCMRDS